jgi:N-acetylmuramic acid 6-phosphate etherase
MVSVVATNAKLRLRTVRILQEAADLDEQAALAVLDAADGDLKTAIVSALSGADAATSRDLLAAHGGAVRAALDAASAPDRPSEPTTEIHQQ